MNLKKRWMLVAAAAFLAFSNLTAYAAELPEGENPEEKGWQVTFNGKKLESNFDNRDVTDQAKGLQPGDEIIMELSLKNGDGRPSDWYLSNEIRKSFEDPDQTGNVQGKTAQAGGGAYTYILTYTDASGKKELYNSSRVGGEKNGDLQTPSGLNEVEESLGDYVYLGRLKNGQEGKLKLVVALDGETQGNDYAGTLASLKLNFAVESVPEEGTSGGGAGNTVVRRTVKQYVLTGVQTGDTSRVLLWTLTALGSGLLLLWLCMGRLRKSGKDEGGQG